MQWVSISLPYAQSDDVVVGCGVQVQGKVGNVLPPWSGSP